MRPSFNRTDKYENADDVQGCYFKTVGPDCTRHHCHHIVVATEKIFRSYFFGTPSRSVLRPISSFHTEYRIPVTSSDIFKQLSPCERHECSTSYECGLLGSSLTIEPETGVSHEAYSLDYASVGVKELLTCSRLVPAHNLSGRKEG